MRVTEHNPGVGPGPAPRRLRPTGFLEADRVSREGWPDLPVHVHVDFDAQRPWGAVVSAVGEVADGSLEPLRLALDRCEGNATLLDLRLVSDFGIAGAELVERFAERAPILVFPSRIVERTLAIRGLRDLVLPPFAADGSRLQRAEFGVAVFDDHQRLTYVNDRFAERSGWRPVEFLGLQPEHLIEHPDRFAEALGRVIEERVAMRYRERLPGDDGRERVAMLYPVLGLRGRFERGVSVVDAS